MCPPDRSVEEHKPQRGCTISQPRHSDREGVGQHCYARSHVCRLCRTREQITQENTYSVCIKTLNTDPRHQIMNVQSRNKKNGNTRLWGRGNFLLLHLRERMIISEGRGEIQGFINGLRRGAGWMKRGFKSEKTN